MISKSLCLGVAILWAVVALRVEPVVAEGLPSSATLLDDKMVTYMRPVPLVSPDGRLVAYVNRGWVCVADVEKGTSRRLMEVPGCWSHVYASVPQASEGGDANSLRRAVGAEKYKELWGRVKNEINVFQWTVDSAAVVFGTVGYNKEKRTKAVHIWRAPLLGEPQEIASTEGPLSMLPGPGDMLTRDGRFLVGNSYSNRSLIWDIATNKPRATPFYYLAPSPASGRWIGVEKDTRQLVVVDEDFEVIKRYAVILPDNRHGFDMIWSPDERFIFWRQKIGFDYYSNWLGCRYDLQTGERQIFTGDYWSEQIAFTGQRGEFTRVGADGIERQSSGLTMTRQYVGLVPDGRYYMQHFWSQRADPCDRSSDARRLGSLSKVTWSPDAQLFTIGLPRQEGPHGTIYHLGNRKRHLWKLPGEDTGSYYSPYLVASFALHGKSIVAYDETRLFVVPIAAIKTEENKVR